MSAIMPTVTQVGAGVLVSSTGATTAVPNVSVGVVNSSDLVMAICYMAGDATLVSDLGDGWVILDAGYDAANTFGIFLAVMVNGRPGSTGHLGFQLPASVAFTLQCYTLRLAAGSPFRWDVANAVGSRAWINAAASSTTLAVPAIVPSNSSGIYLCGCGYNNGGTTTTVGTLGSHTELFDTGQTSPPHGVTGSFLNTIQTSAVMQASVSSSLAVAKTNRAGVRAFVPIVENNTMMRGRYLGSRRVG